MRRTFKVFFTIIIIFVFIISIFFNILLFSSSYASLMLKQNKSLYLTMHEDSKDFFELDNQKEYGFHIEAENVEGCISLISDYYVDNEGKKTVKSVCSKNEEDKTVVYTYYFYNNKVFVEVGEAKTKEEITFEGFLNSYPHAYKNVVEILNTDLMVNNKENKTKLHFSFSPFYVLGIKYSFKVEENNTYTFKYDLKGRVRILSIEGENSSNIKIKYNTDSISFPDLTEFK